MRWSYESAFERGGGDCDWDCTVCGKRLTGSDIVYLGNDANEDQAEQIKRIFGVDVYGPPDFLIVCEQCMEGHCGANPGYNANTWLAEQVRRYELRNPNS